MQQPPGPVHIDRRLGEVRRLLTHARIVIDLIGSVLNELPSSRLGDTTLVISTTDRESHSSEKVQSHSTDTSVQLFRAETGRI